MSKTPTHFTPPRWELPREGENGSAEREGRVGKGEGQDRNFHRGTRCERAHGLGKAFPVGSTGGTKALKGRGHGSASPHTGCEEKNMRDEARRLGRPDSNSTTDRSPQTHTAPTGSGPQPVCPGEEAAQLWREGDGQTHRRPIPHQPPWSPVPAGHRGHVSRVQSPRGQKEPPGRYLGGKIFKTYIVFQFLWHLTIFSGKTFFV